MNTVRITEHSCADDHVEIFWNGDEPCPACEAQLRAESIARERDCPQCGASTVRPVRELLDHRRWMWWCDACKHMWRPEQPKSLYFTAEGK